MKLSDVIKLKELIKGEKMNPKISIILPVYNAEKYLNRCFDSILSNNYKNLEIIPVNDGSKDNSQEIIEKYKNKYPEIFNPIHQENQGIGMTRNNGLKKATGEYIMFIDNDDFIDKDYIEKHIKEVEKNNYDIVISGYKRVSDEKTLFSVVLDDNYRWSRYISIAPWGKLYKASFLKENDIKFLKTPIGEDIYFNLQANTLTENLKIIEYTGYNWYYNGKSVTNTITNKIKKVNVIELLNTHYGILKQKNSINDNNYDLIELYFILLIIQFLQWISYDSTYKEISDNYDKYFEWLEKHFPNYKKCKYWRLSKGDRLKIRLIICTFMNFHKIHLGKFLVFIYGKISS